MDPSRCSSNYEQRITKSPDNMDLHLRQTHLNPNAITPGAETYDNSDLNGKVGKDPISSSGSRGRYGEHTLNDNGERREEISAA
ncbi:hypothetical protein ILUMI_20830 [Ignelater luminosus]|uniref:Uncharacterized protein n=1 Tax=Ignelater luminosus TaxID=2038154 RepID=A0A8K0G478_IGNLU|nr:hypothetical protein ILUMI_20830 [Ignelater luminosus]